MGSQEFTVDQAKGSPKPSSSTGELTLKSSGEVVLNPQETAVEAPEGKHIHARRLLPVVADAPSGDVPTQQAAEEKGEKRPK